MPGSLFTQDYLAHGVRAGHDWLDAQSRLPAFRARMAAIFDGVANPAAVVEAEIETRIVQPVLDALGWAGLWTPQTRIDRKGRKNVPDYLFFATPEDHAKADPQPPHDRYRHAIALGDAKAWSVSLDKRGGGAGQDEAPTGQLLRYMDAASAASDRRVLWGLLTNGRVWRLYYQDARSRLDDYFEVDLEWALERPGAQGAFDLDQARPDDLTPAEALTLFLLFFERDAFLPGSDGRTFHQVALDEGRRWEARIRDDLSEVVFNTVFPGLIRAIVAADRQANVADSGYLAEVREAALTALYRLLFALYAEDRDLLPTRSKRFDDYSLSHLRDEVAKRLADQDALSEKRGPMWSRSRDLFRLIDEGDDSLGVPPYNGGLFSQDRSPLLERLDLSDAAFAPILSALSHVDGKRINYRDLSVRELGSIYERLLEHEPVADPAAPNGVDVRLSVFARKGSGSYYTPDVLVKLIIERTLTPLAEEAEAAFSAALDALPARAAPATVRAELDAHDPARRILSFKVVDPAMGSGHFLVSLVDWLAERALIADEAATQQARERDLDWSSPATREIAALREQVQTEAADNGWTVAPEQLSDANLIKRAVLKRCVYGVDKNPMAVELAKVALWLHTFTAGAPLSFLDHHLRCGDSLFGERVADVLGELHKRGSLLIAGAVSTAQASVKAMEHIEGLSDARLEDVKESERSFADVTQATQPLTAFLDLWHAVRWLKPAGDDLKAWHGFLDGQFGDPLAVASSSAEPNRPPGLPADATIEWLDQADPEDQPSLLGPGASTYDYLRLIRLLARARDLVAEQRFLHWQVAFPGVWTNWTSSAPQGGFDAVIGNPPWEYVELDEVPWFEVRKPAIARATDSAQRQTMIRQLNEDGDPIWLQYEIAKDAHALIVAAIRSSKSFGNLASGRLNFYKLFVARARALVKSTGVAGLLCPTGIVTDLSSGKFVSEMLDESRICCVLDFENRGALKGRFFPAVDGRAKFSAFVFGGSSRRFQKVECGFFLTEQDLLSGLTTTIWLAPDHIARFNQNSGTFPIFRSSTEAGLDVKIFGTNPLFEDAKTKHKPLSVTYSQMLNMTSANDKFRTIAQLRQIGAYEVEFGHWAKGSEEWVPLIEGKMVDAYDHRFAGVEVDANRLFRPGQPSVNAEKEKIRVDFYNTGRYWVNKSDLPPYHRGWILAFKDLTSSTNHRTMLAFIAPFCGFNHKAPVFYEADGSGEHSVLAVANFNAHVYDYVVRNRLNSNSLPLFLIKQTPVIPPAAYGLPIGKTTARDIVRDHVLRLSYTSHDLAPFARDMGWVDDDGQVKPPFVWDEDERRLLRARLDALYFILYGLTDPDDVRHVLSTFPIVRRKDVQEHGVYLTELLILWYVTALQAGDATRNPPVADLIAQARRGNPL